MKESHLRLWFVRLFSLMRVELPYFKEQNKLGASVVKRLGLWVSFLCRLTFCVWQWEGDCKMFSTVSDHPLVAQFCCFLHWSSASSFTHPPFLVVAFSWQSEVFLGGQEWTVDTTCFSFFLWGVQKCPSLDGSIDIEKPVIVQCSVNARF